MSSDGSKPRHEGWDAYWDPRARGAHRVYALVASLYRRVFICGRLARCLGRHFPRGCELLHAGCGGGEVDVPISEVYRITALDISSNALLLYEKHNPSVMETVHADLLDLDLGGRLFDGAYNLGVMEHFEEGEIIRILRNMMGVVRPGGKLVLFWPVANAPSVKILGAWHRLLNRRNGPNIRLHPAEVTLIRSEDQVRGIVEAAGLVMTSFEVSARDLFVQAVVVAERP